MRGGGDSSRIKFPEFARRRSHRCRESRVFDVACAKTILRRRPRL